VSAYPQYYVINATPYDTGVVNNEGTKLALEAENWPTSVIFFTTATAANNYSVQHGGIGTKGPTYKSSQVGNAVQSTAAKATGNIDDLINFFQSGSLWTRIGEALAGFILLYVGLKAAVTPNGQQPARRTIKDTAKTIAKVAK